MLTQQCFRHFARIGRVQEGSRFAHVYFLTFDVRNVGYDNTTIDEEGAAANDEEAIS